MLDNGCGELLGGGVSPLVLGLDPTLGQDLVDAAPDPGPVLAQTGVVQQVRRTQQHRRCNTNTETVCS